MKSIQEVEEYILNPNMLKNLRTGEVLMVCLKDEPHKTYLENEYRAGYARAILSTSSNLGWNL
jgi:hypothetical protein